MTPKSGGSKFAIPANLSQVKLSQPPPQEDTSRQAKDEFQLDSSVTIDKDAFLHELNEVRNRMAADNRMSLATALNPDNAVLEHNRWTQQVSNEIQQKMLGHEKQIVADLREKLRAPSLHLLIEVVEPTALQTDQVPYTMQEKLEAMKQKNPSLESFLRRFNANIQYD